MTKNYVRGTIREWPDLDGIVVGGVKNAAGRVLRASFDVGVLWWVAYEVAFRMNRQLRETRGFGSDTAGAQPAAVPQPNDLGPF